MFGRAAEVKCLRKLIGMRCFNVYDISPKEWDIPVLVFSAGLADIIEEVIKETMRFYTVSPLVARETSTQVEVGGYVLPKILLVEIMDFGYPQNLSPGILKLYITQEGVRSPFSSKPSDKPVPNATLQVTGAVGWRREGLVYKKNEVFLDIVESVNLLMSSKGSVLRCDVTGKILMKCFLSGMPDLKLGLNDKIGLEKESQIKSRPTKSGKTIELDDVTFHQCVNLTRFNSEKTVSFVPPDGEFELMKYRITEGVNLLFRVLPTIKELGRTRMEVNVKVKSVFGAKMFALGVVVKVPAPKQTAKTSFQVTSGRAKYNASIDCIV